MLGRLDDAEKTNDEDDGNAEAELNGIDAELLGA